MIRDDENEERGIRAVVTVDEQGEQLLPGYADVPRPFTEQLVGVLTGPTASMLTMAGDQRRLLASLVAGAVVNIGASAWLVPAPGALGAAFGTLGGLIVANVTMLAVLRRRYGLRLRFRWRAAVGGGLL